MFFPSLEKLRLHDIPRELLWLAVVNGLSDMALNGAAIFGTLAVLTGSYFIHGVTGLGFYVAARAISTFVGYFAVCRFGAQLGLKIRHALYIVFIIHAVGFALAAFVHPFIVSISDGLGLGTFYAVFMLKNINDIQDHARDRFATINGLIQQCITLTAPLLGTAMLYVGVHMGISNPFLPPFLAFSLCVLIALPIIRQIPNAPLPCSVVLPMRAVMEAHHTPAIAFIYLGTFYGSLMNLMLIVSSFALLGKVVSVGGFAAIITVLAGLSLALSHYIRIPGKRWRVFGICSLGIGLGFAAFNVSFQLETLLMLGAVYAFLQVNYSAVWFSMGTRLLEHEWGHFGKNQALVVGEVFTLAARLTIALLFLVCGALDLTLRQNLAVLTGFYLTAALINSLLARYLDLKHKAAA